MKTKKLLAGLLSAAMVLGTMAFPVFADDANWADSANTDWYTNAESEYTLNTAKELAGLASLVNSGTSFANKTIKLGNDIDLEGIEWTPIGKQEGEKNLSFQGTFDGNGKTVKNLVITGSTNSDVGLFGFTTNGEIKNFTLENARVSGHLDVGAVAGTPYTSKYTDITVKGSIKIDGYAYVGGALGKNAYANLTNVDVIGDEGSYVKADSAGYRTYVGGLVGFMGEGNQTIADCDVAIDVTGSTCDIGGISGILHYGNKMVNCTYRGSLALTNPTDTTDMTEIGGLVGTYLTKSGCVTSIEGCSAEIESAMLTDLEGIARDIKDEITATGAAWKGTENDGEHNVAATINGREEKFTNNVANIGSVKYFSLESAVAAAQDGDTVEMLADTTGNGIIVDSGRNFVIDFGGHTYTVDGATIGSTGTETNGFQLKKDSNITFKNGKITSNKAAILIQNYSNLTLEDITLELTTTSETIVSDDKTSSYVLSNNNGNTVIKGNTNIIAGKTAKAYAFDIFSGWKTAYPSVSVIIDESMTGTINGDIEISNWDKTAVDLTLEIKNGTVNGNILDNRSAAEKEKNQKLDIVYGGTFSTNVKAYVADGYFVTDNGDGTYTVKNKVEKLDNENATTEEKVETINSVVISKENTAVTEKVVETIKNLPVEAKEEIAPAKVEEIIATKDASEVKTAKAEANVSGDDTANVTATLKSIDSSLNLTIEPKTVDDSSILLPAGTKAARFEVTVTKTTGGSSETIQETDVPMLLTFKVENADNIKSVIRYHDNKQESVPFVKGDDNTLMISAAKFSEYVVLEKATPAAGSAVLKFEDDVDGDGICNIYLVGDADSTVTNFESGEFTVTNTASSGTVGMTLTGADGLTIDEVKDGYYKIHRPKGSSSYRTVTDSKILLGTIALSGTGKGQIYAENIKMYRKSTDSENLAVEIPTTSDIVSYDIQAETAELTVKVTFPNAVENQTTAYQDMKITISGGDLADSLSYNLGSNASENVDWSNTDATYTLTVADKLTKNVAYTVKVEGAGYRTARYTVNMTGAKTLNFWNNVKDAAINVEEGMGTATKTTFLAGDIVKDNQINIYDLSAVVSYFGTDNLVSVHPEYAKYDLNRDGKIDSKDIAYVLVSWGN